MLCDFAFQKGLSETKKQSLLKLQGILKERNIVKKEFSKEKKHKRCCNNLQYGIM